MLANRNKGNQQTYIIVAAVVLVLVIGGGYYYFGVYMPNYEAERLQLVTLTAVSDPIDLDPALSFDTESNRVIINIFDRLLTYKSGTTEVAAVFRHRVFIIRLALQRLTWFSVLRRSHYALSFSTNGTNIPTTAATSFVVL